MKIGEVYQWRGIPIIIAWVRDCDLCIVPAREEYRTLVELTRAREASDG